MVVRPDIEPPQTPVADAPGDAADVLPGGFEVAPAWQLVWWRFRKHRLALLCALLCLPLLLVALLPEFFSTRPPAESNARLAYVPPQPIHFFDQGRFRPFVYGIKGSRNPETLRLSWQTDPATRYQVGFFVRGYPYRLLGLIPTDRHLIGLDTDDPDATLFLLGTDRLGRDMWSRLMLGTRTSLSVGWVGVMLSLLLGVVLGGISGYFGGLIDTLIQRLIELLQSLPTIPIWLALTASLPRDWTPTQVYFAITVILSIVGWTTLGREVRGQFLALRDADYVLAAQMLGSSSWRVIFKHMLSACTSHIIAVSTLSIPAMILNETSLSFLGLGLRAPVISWGVLLQEAQNLQSVSLAPWLLIPGAVVVVTVLTLNIIGDGLRDAADPYSYH